MTDFPRIDPNFKVEPCFSQEGLAFYNVTKPPFSLHGLLWEEGCFRRLPRQVTENVSNEKSAFTALFFFGCFFLKTMVY